MSILRDMLSDKPSDRPFCTVCNEPTSEIYTREELYLWYKITEDFMHQCPECGSWRCGYEKIPTPTTEDLKAFGPDETGE